MTNGKSPLPTLLSKAVVLSLILAALMLNVTSVAAQEQVTPMVTAGGHTAGLKTDGTVVVTEWNEGGAGNLTEVAQIMGWTKGDVDNWTYIVQIAAGAWHTVGLRTDGTVVAAGSDRYWQCDVGGWTDIVQVATGSYHTVGLRSNGTAVAVGLNHSGQCDVGAWKDIVQVAAGGWHTVGLRTDGTVVAAGRNYDGQSDVGGWKDIIQLAAGFSHTVGLKSNGTMVAVGHNNHRQCNVIHLGEIVQVVAGDFHTVGLKTDGTVVAVGHNASGQCNVDGWTGVVQVAAGCWHSVGLKSDGTVVAVGSDYKGQCNVAAWSLGVIEYALTISSAGGGSVSEPGEGTFTYNKDMLVNLVATSDAGYEFVNWTGDVSTIADVEEAATTVAMNADHAIAANFEEIPLPPVKWQLVGGIIAAVVVVGAGLFVIHRRKVGRTKAC